MIRFRDIDKYLASALKRIFLLATRGRVLLSKDVVEKHQELQVRFLKDETIQIERLQDFGFCSRPPKGAECLGIFLGGNRDQGVAIAVGDRRFRIALEEGEATVYATDGIDIIASMKCLKSGQVVINAGGGQNVEVNAGGDVDVNATGDVTVDGVDVTVTASGVAEVVATTKAIITAPLTYLGGESGALKVARDGDPIVGGAIQASTTKVFSQ